MLVQREVQGRVPVKPAQERMLRLSRPLHTHKYLFALVEFISVKIKLSSLLFDVSNFTFSELIFFFNQ